MLLPAPNGANICMCDKFGFNVLVYVSKSGQGNIKMKKNGATFTMQWGKCWFMEKWWKKEIFFLQSGHDSIVRLLLQYKADVNLSYKDGTDPVHAACKNWHTSTV